MLCERCQLLLEDFLDDALSAESARQVAQHLRECAACSEYEQKLRKYRALIAPLCEPVQPPEAFCAGWRAALASQTEDADKADAAAHKKTRAWGRRKKYTAVAACIAAVCIAGGIALGVALSASPAPTTQLAAGSDVESLPSLPVYNSAALSNRYTLTTNVQTLEVYTPDTTTAKQRIYNYAQVNGIDIAESADGTLWLVTGDDVCCDVLEDLLAREYAVHCTNEADGAMCVRLTTETR